MYSKSQGKLPGQSHDYRYESLAYVTDVGSDTRWGTVSGLFNAHPILAGGYMAAVYVNRAGTNVNLAIDDVSLISFVKDCSNLVLNGDFDEDGTANHWEGSPPLAVHFDGANGSSTSIIQTGRTSSSNGPYQVLDTGCFEAEEFWTFSAMVKMLDGGNVFSCNPNVVLGDDGCPFARLKSVTPSETKYRDIAAVVSTQDADGWYHLHGVFEMYEYDKDSSYIDLLIYGAKAGVDLIIDEVVIEKMVGETP